MNVYQCSVCGRETRSTSGLCVVHNPLYTRCRQCGEWTRSLVSLCTDCRDGGDTRTYLQNRPQSRFTGDVAPTPKQTPAP